MLTVGVNVTSSKKEARQKKVFFLGQKFKKIQGKSKNYEKKSKKIKILVRSFYARFNHIYDLSKLKDPQILW